MPAVPEWPWDLFLKSGQEQLASTWNVKQIGAFFSSGCKKGTNKTCPTVPWGSAFQLATGHFLSA